MRVGARGHLLAIMDMCGRPGISHESPWTDAGGHERMDIVLYSPWISANSQPSATMEIPWTPVEAPGQ